jgi:CRISPR-associated endonuclease/helicase Cas3
MRAKVPTRNESTRQLFFAHTDPVWPNDPPRWEPLFTPECCALSGEQCDACERLDRNHGHLNKVAWWTGKFAEEMFPLGSEEAKAAYQWGYLVGLWHDLGKFAPKWQDYLRSKADIHRGEISGRVDHSTAGAIHAASLNGFHRLLGYAIAGHHGGLPDGQSLDGASSSLEARLTKQVEQWSAALITSRPDRLSPPPLTAGLPERDHQVAFFTRMIFSCLVDADFLATESFMSPFAAKDRPVWPNHILVRMEAALTRHLAGYSAERGRVNRERQSVLEACQCAAGRTPGLFTLTVPTGGGKTFSSLAFALRHALAHGLRRVIYVIPFTSIIEQNADCFREVFGELERELGFSPVLEQHSNLRPQHATELNRLTSENWDAPLMVTTSVQFFESLFAARTSRCRKLHRLARSVIILDEAQTLPITLLAPCLSVLRLLLKDYGASVVLCTATQPALTFREEFKIGLRDATEIVEDVPALFASLQRTKISVLGKKSDAELVALISQHPSSLTVVNTRRHAAELFAALSPASQNFHLSAQMCPDHRSKTIRVIRKRLAKGRPCRVISTQLIEAGVDLDFPVVFRSLGGLDSIAQAAGRCNREGLLPEYGEVFVFEAEHPIPRGHLRQTADTARPLLHAPDLSDPALIRMYFENLYWKRASEWDARQIMPEFRLRSDLLGFRFRTVAEKFRLIDEEMRGVIVPYGRDYEELINSLRYAEFPGREMIRRAQRRSVQLHPHTFAALLASGHIRAIDSDERFHGLTDLRLYHPRLGVLTEPDAFYSEPEKLIVA